MVAAFWLWRQDYLKKAERFGIIPENIPWRYIMDGEKLKKIIYIGMIISGVLMIL